MNRNYSYSMTELRIISRQPSIQNIQLNPDSPPKGLTQLEVNKLFVRKPLPKFELIDIKMHNSLNKKEKSQFFISVLQRWNRRVEQYENFATNARTQFLMMEFIYSSMKRFCLINQTQIDQQLNILYRWFVAQNKNNTAYMRSQMPKPKSQNQYYLVTQTFKTNPTIILQQYRRHKLFLRSDKKQPIKGLLQFNQNVTDRKLNNNFLTQIQQSHDRLYLKDKNPHKDQQDTTKVKCLLLKREQKKIMDQELRKYRQKKQIQFNEWSFKTKKGRLMSQSSKNYLSGKFNTSIRKGVKSSQGTRQQGEQISEQEEKKIRLHTSSEKRIGKQNGGQKNLVLPQVSDVNSYGLLINPLEVKIKKKKSKKI